MLVYQKVYIYPMMSLVFHIAKAPPPHRRIAIRTSLSSVQRRRSRWAQKAWTSGQKLAGRQQSSTSRPHGVGGKTWHDFLGFSWDFHDFPTLKWVNYNKKRWVHGISMGLNWIHQGKMLISLDFRMISGCTTKKTVGLMAVNTQTLWFQKFNEPHVGFQGI